MYYVDTSVFHLLFFLILSHTHTHSSFFAIFIIQVQGQCQGCHTFCCVISVDSCHMLFGHIFSVGLPNFRIFLAELLYFLCTLVHYCKSYSIYRTGFPHFLFFNPLNSILDKDNYDNYL